MRPAYIKYTFNGKTTYGKVIGDYGDHLIIRSSSSAENRFGSVSKRWKIYKYSDLIKEIDEEEYLLGLVLDS